MNPISEKIEKYLNEVNSSIKTQRFSDSDAGSNSAKSYVKRKLNQRKHVYKYHIVGDPGVHLLHILDDPKHLKKSHETTMYKDEKFDSSRFTKLTKDNVNHVLSSPRDDDND